MPHGANNKIYQSLQNALVNNVKRDVSLKEYTTFKIGGPAKYFFVAMTTDDLVRAVTTAKKLNIPYCLLGSGANVLVSDKGFSGLIIIAKNEQIKISDTLVKAESGASIGSLVLATVQHGLKGIECWAGIPGTVGGSIYGNMGLPQVKKGFISDWLTTVEVLRDGERITMTNKECGFKYRHSIFKTNNDIILEATFQLEKSDDKKASIELMKDYQKKKARAQPLDLPSSGCIFKNPKGMSAGKLIDDLGLKGKTIGGARVSEKHGNFIHNLGGARAEDVVMLISLIKQKVRTHHRIQLEEEINFVGF